MIKEKQEIKGNRNQSHSVNKLIATLKKLIHYILFYQSIYLSIYLCWIFAVSGHHISVVH